MTDIKTLLEGVRDGRIDVDEAVLELKKKPFEDIGFAKVDLHRRLRQGASEVIYGQGKTPEQIIGILDAMRANGQESVIITRLSKESAAIISSEHPIDYHEDAGIGLSGPMPVPDGLGSLGSEGVIRACGHGPSPEKQHSGPAQLAGPLFCGEECFSLACRWAADS